MFEEKTKEELEKMSAVELQDYWAAKFKHEQEQRDEKISELEKQIKAANNSDETEKLQKEIDKQKEINEALETSIEKLKKREVFGPQVANLDTAIKQMVKENKDNLEACLKSNKVFNMALKAAGDMTISGNVSGGNFPQATRLPGINNIYERKPMIYDLFPKINISGNTVEWVYETSQDGSPGATAEGASKNQIDNDFVVTSVSLAKRTAYFKVSTELLNDPDGFASWLRSKLIARLLVDVNAFVLTQMLAISTVFAAGGHANQVDNANAIDSLNVALDQVVQADHELMIPVIVMNHFTLTQLKYLKVSPTDRRYVDVINEIATSQSLGGIPIVAHNGITSGDFLVGDLAKALIIQKSDIMIEVGLDGNDLTKNLRTMVGEWRGEVIIQQNDRLSFITGTFAVTNAALETP